ncbi:alpha/beta hydrolase [Actinocrinis puniceicyclus]|uniref:Alpha/beta hydrolase n=1 Tax=Actinocrinis puniceicyclus TaxID=977794 RepID=A0A8J7WUF3_9ACTN|nr:alpha/beta hydrolase [Actinocrinis puniceicyclus]MBS2965970.1 alpha/beta hydrolase [Actinocrinis puniceicyclus]
MPLVSVDGVKIGYSEHGEGEPVLMVMGTGSPGHVWELHQVPALVRAGYRVITFDNRGIAPLAYGAPKPTVEDIVGDVVGLIRYVCGGRAHLIGTSMGAHVVQEVLVAHPELAASAVLMATRGRQDAFRTALADAEARLYASGVQPPPLYTATAKALQSLSPHTLNDEAAVRTWLDLLELFPPPLEVLRAQTLLESIGDRLGAYRTIAARCMVLAFADDLITPPHLNREVADAIAGCRYELVERCGHFGYLERPDAVNALLLDFLDGISTIHDERRMRAHEFPAKTRT